MNLFNTFSILLLQVQGAVGHSTFSLEGTPSQIGESAVIDRIHPPALYTAHSSVTND